MVADVVREQALALGETASIAEPGVRHAPWRRAMPSLGTGLEQVF